MKRMITKKRNNENTLDHKERVIRLVEYEKQTSNDKIIYKLFIKKGMIFKINIIKSTHI